MVTLCARFGTRGSGRWQAWLLLTALLSGCSSCDQPPLRVENPFPHTRCLAAEPPPEGTRKLGGLTLTRKGRELRVEGAPEPVRVAAFAGPGPAAPVTPAVVASLAEREPTLALMLGGLGEDDTSAADTLAAFAEVPFPVLYVPGGRDNWQRWKALWAGQPEAVKARVFEVASSELIKIGGEGRNAHELVPIAGAADGRYAVNGDSCGYALEDLQARARALPEPQGLRYLIAWQAPGRGGALAVARDQAGQDVGSDALAELAARVASPGGIYAWPVLRVDEPVAGGGQRLAAPNTPAPDLQVVVPRLTGPSLVRADGSRVSAGFLMLTLGPGGMRYLGRVEAPKSPRGGVEAPKSPRGGVEAPKTSLE